jgi:hypothetical protein
MGYIIVGIVAIVFIVFLLVRLGSSAGRRPARGTEPPAGHPLMVAKPAADEPTPGRSDLASPKQADEAARRTPPA